MARSGPLRGVIDEKLSRQERDLADAVITGADILQTDLLKERVLRKRILREPAAEFRDAGHHIILVSGIFEQVRIPVFDEAHQDRHHSCLLRREIDLLLLHALTVPLRRLIDLREIFRRSAPVDGSGQRAVHIHIQIPVGDKPADPLSDLF